MAEKIHCYMKKEYKNHRRFSQICRYIINGQDDYKRVNVNSFGQIMFLYKAVVAFLFIENVLFRSPKRIKKNGKDVVPSMQLTI